MSSYNRNSKQICCTNCGEFGHHFRSCNKPIYSYGIIGFKHTNPSWNQVQELLKDDNTSSGFSINDINVLMIQRRDSIGYIELIRAKYKSNDIEYIKEQISGTTEKERTALLTKSFDYLWLDLWGNSSFETKQYKQEFEQAKYKFEQLKEGLDVDGTKITLAELIEQIPIQWDTPEWGFPKGRRNILEKDLECAKREFMEETGLTEKQFTIFKNIEPIHETFYGNNSIHYCHVYYLAWIHSSVEVIYNTENLVMTKEIGNIGWFSFDDAIKHIRSTNVDKREILKRSIKILEELSILNSVALHNSENEEEPQNRNEQFRQYGSANGDTNIFNRTFKRRTYSFMED
jgi:8-oxo-dGTP pyrophosphatase MutT (NUDIX family)